MALAALDVAAGRAFAGSPAAGCRPAGALTIHLEDTVEEVQRCSHEHSSFLLLVYIALQRYLYRKRTPTPCKPHKE